MASHALRLAVPWLLVARSGCDHKKASENDLNAAQGIGYLRSAQGRTPYGRPDSPGAISKLTITGAKFTVTHNYGGEESGDITLDASTDPKRCAFTGLYRSDKPHLAIYDLSGNTLRLCLFYRTDVENSSHDYLKDRPGKLEPADDVIVYTFTR